MDESDFWTLDLNTRKLCTEKFYKDEKARVLLCEYYNSLTSEEQELFEEMSDKYYDFKRMGSRGYNISYSAVLIATRLKKECGYTCYPMIEKIARKGWSTADGTFAWSIPLLKLQGFNEINCFEPTSWFTLKKTKLDVDVYQKVFLVVGIEKIRKEEKKI